MAQTIQKLPRGAINQWKKYVEGIKAGKILENLKAQKLKILLQILPIRTMKDAKQRILGGGDKIKGAIRDLETKIKQVPR